MKIDSTVAELHIDAISMELLTGVSVLTLEFIRTSGFTSEGQPKEESTVGENSETETSSQNLCL